MHFALGQDSSSNVCLFTNGNGHGSSVDWSWGDIMLRVVLVLGSIIGMAGTAYAADMAVRKAPIVSEQVSWVGFYIGGHAGYAAGRSMLLEAGIPGSFDANVKGFLGGAQIGARTQSGSWVFGVEADISGADIKGSATTLDGNGDTVSTNPRTRWVSLLTGQVGVASGPTLVYAKGGAAFAGVDYTARDLTAGTSSSAKITQYGWTVGGGLEYALDRSWSVRAEYNYIHLRSPSFSLADPAGGAPAIVSLEQRLHEGRLGVNYRF